MTFFSYPNFVRKYNFILLQALWGEAPASASQMSSKYDKKSKRKIIVISCNELLSNPMCTTNLASYLFLENECTILRRGVVRKWKLSYVKYLFSN